MIGPSSRLPAAGATSAAITAAAVNSHRELKGGRPSVRIARFRRRCAWIYDLPHISRTQIMRPNPAPQPYIVSSYPRRCICSGSAAEARLQVVALVGPAPAKAPLPRAQDASLPIAPSLTNPPPAHELENRNCAMRLRQF